MHASRIDNPSNVFVKGLELACGQRLRRNEGQLGAVRGCGASVCPGSEAGSRCVENAVSLRTYGSR